MQERRTIGSRKFEDQAKRLTQRRSKLEAEIRFQTNVYSRKIFLVQQLGKAGFITFYISLQEDLKSEVI